MNGKSNVKKTAAVFLGLALAMGGVGCSNFIVTDSAKDLAQTVATVDISTALADDPTYGSVAGELGNIVENLTKDITKRDLVAYFLSTGYQYVESYGYTYEDTFNMLMDGLVSREIMIQYAIAYYLKNNDGLNEAGCKAYIDAQLNEASEKEKALLKANPEVLTLKYFLTDGGKADEMEEYNRTVYNLKKSLNDSLDSLEENYIIAESEEHDHGEARTLPTNVTTEKEDYWTEDYDVYTGRNTISSCGIYEKVEGSTTSTRKSAYNAFLANLQGYNMISTSGAVEDTSKVTMLNYYYVELSSLLGQALVNKYFEDEADRVTEALDANYMQERYEALYNTQKESYSTSVSAFDTAMGNVSDTSFLVYGLEDFGYVYNILIPFSASQNVAYTTAKNNTANTEEKLFEIRRDILTDVKAKDLRGSWISSHDHANYSSTVQAGDETRYYFFKDNMECWVKGLIFGTEGEPTIYENLKQYQGRYYYRGTVTEKDGELVAKPNEVGIDEFIGIFKSYIKDLGTTVTVTGRENPVYANENSLEFKNDDDEVNYEKFIYYEGEVEFTETPKAKDYFNKDSSIYKVISAVNELMFAYSTDTGCLNTYFGYAVSPYKTNFVKEFEYAAQTVVKSGVGSYAVCATDYGWHIIFASYVFDKTGNVFDIDGDPATIDGYVHAEAVGDNKIEGSFSNLFYESVKSTVAQNYSTEVQNKVLNAYNNGESVKRHEARYSDLLALDKN